MQSVDAPSSERFVTDGHLRPSGRCDAYPPVGDRRRSDALTTRGRARGSRLVSALSASAVGPLAGTRGSKTTDEEGSDES